MPEILPSAEVEQYPHLIKLTHVDWAQLVVEAQDLPEAEMLAILGMKSGDILRILAICQQIGALSGVIDSPHACTRPPQTSKPLGPRFNS